MVASKRLSLNYFVIISHPVVELDLKRSLRAGLFCLCRPKTLLAEDVFKNVVTRINRGPGLRWLLPYTPATGIFWLLKQRPQFLQYFFSVHDSEIVSYRVTPSPYH